MFAANAALPLKVELLVKKHLRHPVFVAIGAIAISF
mgnify:CR=1 FL=1